jgi:putative YhbY family RNA-binding protein
MAELILPQEQSLALRARAQRLDPVVRMGAAGLSEALLREVDRALIAHGLVKVRGPRLEREERDELFRAMADRLGAARVQLIGHTFVLFRPPAEKERAPVPRPASSPRARLAPSGRKAPARAAPAAGPVRAGAARARRGAPR